MFKKLFLAVALLCATPFLAAQSCTTAVCNAATPNESDVLAAMPSSGNTNSTVVVNVPTGTAAWTTGFTLHVPTAVTSLTIKGNTNITWSGTAGTSSWAYTTADNTVIQDAYTSNNALMTFQVGGSSSLVVITGLTLEGGSITGYSKYNGVIDIQSGTAEFRFYNNHCNWTTYASGGNTNVCVRTFTPLTEAVADHNVIDNDTKNTTYSFGFSNFGAYNDSYGNGDGTFANATPWGQLSGVFFVEENYMNGGVINDCGNAGAMVIRDNTFSDYSVAIQTHGTKSPAGPGRGCRSIEMYHNYIPSTICSTCSTTSAVLGTKGATAMIWGNVVSGQPSYRLYQGGGDRQSGDEVETNTPQGWGYCGTSVNSNGVGSPWDQNSNVGSGYACLDGLGRGQDVQHLNGGNFCSSGGVSPACGGRLNSVTGTIAWSHQYLEPQYLWGNTLGGIGNYMLLNDGSVNNQDYYYDCGSLNSSCSSGFTGAAGTGQGLLASRPSTCTAGPGGASGTSPTGSYGVFYFATDANSGRGEGYVCSATNTWTPIYEPAVSPHPLITGSPTYTISTATAGTGSGTVTGCAGSYAPGASYSCNVAANTGSTLSSVTGCSGSGSTTYSGLMPSSNCTVTATFAIDTFTFGVSTLGTGGGIVSTCSNGTYNYNTTITCTQSANVGSTFTGWGGSCSGTGSCSFSLTANSTVTATFTLDTQVATPTFSPVAGTYSSTQTVSISTSTGGATLYYTTNGTTPTTSSTVYSGPISVSATTTVKAIGVEAGFTNSSVGTALYTITVQAATPTFSPAAGTYSVAQSVALSDATSGATIYYTTDGSTPTTSSTVYSTAISVSVTTTIKALAVASGYTNSNIGTALYTISASTGTVPSAPMLLSPISVISNSTTVTATPEWEAGASTPTTVGCSQSTCNYNIYRRLGSCQASTNWVEIASNINTLDLGDSTVKPSTQYSYLIYAVLISNKNLSSDSNCVSVTTPALTSPCHTRHCGSDISKLELPGDINAHD